MKEAEKQLIIRALKETERQPHAGRQENRHEPAHVSPQTAHVPSGRILTMPFLQELVHKLEVGGGFALFRVWPGRRWRVMVLVAGLQLARVQKHGHAGSDGRGATGPQYRPGQGLYHAIHPAVQHVSGAKAQCAERRRVAAGKIRGGRPARRGASRSGQSARLSAGPGRADESRAVQLRCRHQTIILEHADPESSTGSRVFRRYQPDFFMRCSTRFCFWR